MNGSYVNGKSNNKQTALYEASYWEHLNNVNLLIKRGADVSVNTKAEGWIDLHQEEDTIK